MNVRYDMIQCHVARPAGTSYEFLQIFRAPGRYMENTWQLVAGKIEPGETAWQAALRELREETSLTPVEFYQIDVINTFYLAQTDTIVHSPCFCALVKPDADVILNEEHLRFRWLPRDQIAKHLMWPGDRAAFAELCHTVLDDGPAKPYLRISLENSSQ